MHDRHIMYTPRACVQAPGGVGVKNNVIDPRSIQIAPPTDPKSIAKFTIKVRHIVFEVIISQILTQNRGGKRLSRQLRAVFRSEVLKATHSKAVSFGSFE